MYYSQWKCALLPLVLISTAGMNPMLAQFYDLDTTSPTYDTIQLMGQLGISGGCAPGAYCPYNALTREDAAVLLVRAWSYKVNSGCVECFSAPTQVSFPVDVPANHPRYRWIQKLADLAITSGCAQNTYCPGDPISNWQMAVFATRISQLIPGHPNYNGTVDDNQIRGSDYAYFPGDVGPAYPLFKNVQNLRDLSTMIAGCGEIAFCPSSALRRDEASYYISRALLRKFLPLKEITTVPTSWEPAAAGGASGSFVAMFRHGGELKATKASGTGFTSPAVVPVPGGRSIDSFLTYDRTRSRYLYVALDPPSNNVWFGMSSDSSGSSWSGSIAIPASSGSYYWDFPSVAVDGSGRILVGAVKFDVPSSYAIGYWTALSTNGGQTFSSPVQVAYDSGRSIPGVRSRVVATRDRFHVFAPSINQQLDVVPYKVWWYQSTDGLNWNTSNPTLLATFTQPAAYSADSVCPPEQTPCAGSKRLFLAPIPDAVGDQNSDSWMVTVPVNNYGLNNILGITPSYAAFIHSDSTSHQFLGSPAVGSDGTFWVSYQTYSSSLQKASSVSSALARIPPNWTPTLSWVARGLAPYTYNLAVSGCGEND